MGKPWVDSDGFARHGRWIVLDAFVAGVLLGIFFMWAAYILR